MLSWSSPSTTKAIIPANQLYTVTNPPPVAVLTGPSNGSSYVSSATVTIAANAAAQFNTLKEVDFYANSTFLGAVSNAPFTLTAAGLGQGSYKLTAVASDLTGLTGTSAPVNITVTAGSGQPYGISGRAPLSPFLNMPTSIGGSVPPLLSQTGVFTNTPAMGALNGLIPYDVTCRSGLMVRSKPVGCRFQTAVPLTLPMSKSGSCPRAGGVSRQARSS